MKGLISKRKYELQQEFNNLLLQEANIKKQLKICRNRIEQVRGAFTELETILSSEGSTDENNQH